jgi:peptidoglycan hydrolase-like protein with peptidoglycan-binding domain
MSKLFLISEEEKNRILNLHESMSKKTTKITELELKEVVSRVLMEQTYKDKVTAIQQELKKRGYDLGNSGPNEDGIDGVYGPKTTQAVIKFQEENGIKQTGFVGDTTAAKLGTPSLAKSKTTTPTSPFTTKEEGDKFRKWVNDNYKGLADKLDLDPSGSHTNKYIIDAWNHKLTDAYTLGKLYKEKTQGQSNVGQSSLSSNIAPNYQGKFNLAALDSAQSVPVCRADTTECGQFVNNLFTKLDYVGNAWNAHDYDPIGPRIKTTYHNWTPSQVDRIYNIFNEIVKKGGPEEKGPQSENIKKLQEELAPNITAADLKKDDIVGIYYPKSPNHEIAFFEAALSGYKPNELPAGKGYFIKDGKGGWKKGRTISGGVGFGMNTHLGIVGAIKDGVPLVFHNVNGQVYSDPYNALYGGGKIMWIRRPK